MTGTDLCVNKSKQSRSYLNHLVHHQMECELCLWFVLGKYATGLPYKLEYVSAWKIRDYVFPTGVFRKFRKFSIKNGNVSGGEM